MALDGVTDGSFTSSDGGITWTTSEVTVSSIDFDSTSDSVLDSK